MEFPKRFDKEVLEDINRYDDIDFTEDNFEEVDVSPLKAGGSNFKTHVLVRKSSSRYAYHSSIGGTLFSLLFLCIGIGALFIGIFDFKSSSISFSSFNWFALLFGGIFGTVGGLLCYWAFLPRIFDKQLGIYYKAFKPDFTHKNRVSKNQFPLKDIKAIQIIGERIQGKNGSYGSFELNLVLDDTTRRNVVDHGNLKSIIDDAQQLSEFLNVPIWHAESHKN